MLKICSIACSIIICLPIFAESLSERIDVLIPALIAVESDGNPMAIGDHGKAKGVLQLHQIYIDDVNSRFGTSYVHNDAFDVEKSKHIVKLYLLHYGKRYERLTGKVATYEVLSRMHNGGPRGYRRPQTYGYWIKVKAHMK